MKKIEGTPREPSGRLKRKFTAIYIKWDRHAFYTDLSFEKGNGDIISKIRIPYNEDKMQVLLDEEFRLSELGYLIYPNNQFLKIGRSHTEEFSYE